MSKYTKGEWKIEDNDIVDEYGDAICTLGAYDDSWTDAELEEMQANAELIASAPKFLEALKKIVYPVEDIRKEAKKAIKRYKSK